MQLPVSPPPSDLTPRFCPKCGESLPDGAVLCTACGYDLRTGRSRTTRVTGGGDKKGLRNRQLAGYFTELWLFGVIFGAGILALGLWTMDGIDPAAPPFLGMSRRYGIGLPIGFCGLCNLAAGGLVFFRRVPSSIACCMLAAGLVPVVGLGILVGSGQRPPCCMTILLMAIPLAVIFRGKKALDAMGESI